MVVLSLGLLAGHVHGDDDVDEENQLTKKVLHGLHGKFDSNGDGKVSMQEVMEMSKEFDKSMAAKRVGSVLEDIDTNKDGKLTLEEHLANMRREVDDQQDKEQFDLMKRVETEKFKAADTNGDKILDATEMPAFIFPHAHDHMHHVMAKETMRQKDANNDGKLTRREFVDFDPDAPENEGVFYADEHLDHEHFTVLDSNGDGHVDLEELKAYASGSFHNGEAFKKLFEMADKDKDGHLTSEELQAVQKEISMHDVRYHLQGYADFFEF